MCILFVVIVTILCKVTSLYFDPHTYVINRPEKFEVQLISTTKDLVKSVHRVPNAGHLVRNPDPMVCIP